MIRPIRWLAGFMVLLVGLIVGLILWIETPAAARWASGWATHHLQQEFPGTQVKIEKISVGCPLRFHLAGFRWGRSGDPVVRIDELLLRVPVSRLLRGRFQWEGRGRIHQLNLSELDAVADKGQWQAKGSCAGELWLAGDFSRVDEVHLQLEAEKPGGTLGGEALKRLLSLMPREEVQAQVLQALEQQKIFHFSVGRFEIETKADIYEIHLLLDGDHLLDITIRIPKESLGILRSLMSGGSR